jgi:hypothetical protein
MSDDYNAGEIKAAIQILQKVLANMRGDTNPAPEDRGDAWEPPPDQPGGRDFKVVPPSEIRDPLAKSARDLVTPKQFGMIRALAREAGVDADEECQQVLRVRTEELSKKAASAFIDHLKGLQMPGVRSA